MRISRDGDSHGRRRDNAGGDCRSVGCSSHSTSSTPTRDLALTTHAPVSDYTKLLIKASDIKAPDPFTAGPPTKDPNGQLGATTTFSDQDHSHVIIDTIQILLRPPS